MIAGLALAPVSRPVMAATSSHAAMAHAAMADEMMRAEMASSDAAASEMTASGPDIMGEMASNMPCCPSKAPMPVDCDKCVFMAACGSIGFPALSATISHPFPIVSDAIALQRDDARPDGLGHPPPEHPPRSLV
jgi:hypothetical protein